MRTSVEHFFNFTILLNMNKRISPQNSNNVVQLWLRRAGHNPTDVEVTDIINKIDSDNGNIDFQVSHFTLLSSASQYDNIGRFFVPSCRTDRRTLTWSPATRRHSVSSAKMMTAVFQQRRSGSEGDCITRAEGQAILRL